MAIGRTAFLPEGSASVLDAVVVRVSLPALILAVVPDVPIDASVLVPFAAAWLQLALLAALVLLASRLLGFDPVTRATLLIVVPLGNTAFLGFPAIEALLGAEVLPFAVVYDQLGTFLALATYASILAARLGRRPSTAQGSALRRVLTFPPFVAALAAVLLRPVGIPEPVAELAAVVGATVTPLAMLAIGMRIDLSSAVHKPLALGTGLALRMLVAPAAVVGAVALLGAEGDVWDVVLLQTAMPPMVTASVVAADAGLDGRLAAALAGVGVLVAMVSLPLWALLTG